MTDKIQIMLLIVLIALLAGNLVVVLPVLQKTNTTLTQLNEQLNDNTLAQANPDQIIIPPVPATAANDSPVSNPQELANPKPSQPTNTTHNPDTSQTHSPSSTTHTKPADTSSASTDSSAPKSTSDPIDPLFPNHGTTQQPPVAANTLESDDPQTTTTPTIATNSDGSGIVDPDPPATQPATASTDTVVAHDDRTQSDTSTSDVTEPADSFTKTLSREDELWVEYGPTVLEITKALLDSPAKATHDRFSPRYARDVPLTAASDLINKLQRDHGRFQAMGTYEVIPAIEPGIHAFKTRATTDLGELKMTVTLNRQKEIVGIHAR